MCRRTIFDLFIFKFCIIHDLSKLIYYSFKSAQIIMQYEICTIEEAGIKRLWAFEVSCYRRMVKIKCEITNKKVKEKNQRNENTMEESEEEKSSTNRTQLRQALRIAKEYRIMGKEKN